MSKKNASAPVEIRFRTYIDTLKKEVIENLRATVLDKGSGFYVIDDIPFDTPEIASDDIIEAKFDKQEKVLIFRYVVQRSGNSTIRISMTSKTADLKALRKLFEELGCVTGKTVGNSFSAEIPSDLEYGPVKEKLEELKSEGTLDFAEAWLSEIHNPSAEA